MCILALTLFIQACIGQMCLGDKIYYQLNNQPKSLDTSTALIEDIDELERKTSFTNKYTASIPVDENIVELQAYCPDKSSKVSQFFIALTSDTSMYYAASYSGLIEKRHLGTKCLASGRVNSKKALCLQAGGVQPQTRDIGDLKVVLLPAPEAGYSSWSHQGYIYQHLYFPRIARGTAPTSLS